MTDNVIKAFKELGYKVTPMKYEEEVKMYKISWEK